MYRLLFFFVLRVLERKSGFLFLDYFLSYRDVAVVAGLVFLTRASVELAALFGRNTTNTFRSTCRVLSGPALRCLMEEFYVFFAGIGLVCSARVPGLCIGSRLAGRVGSCRIGSGSGWVGKEAESTSRSRSLSGLRF